LRGAPLSGWLSCWDLWICSPGRRVPVPIEPRPLGVRERRLALDNYLPVSYLFV